MIINKKSAHIYLLIVLFFISGFSIAFPNHFLEDSFLNWAIRMADSEMKRNPDALTLDFVTKPKWNYTHGLVLTSFSRLWEETQNPSYLSYIKDYIDYFVDESGSIKDYDLQDYNIDKINTGRCLLFLYKHTKDLKYKKAAHLLREQLKTHPRTSEGGFWHKKRYPWQIWLDGLYMGSPFYAEFGAIFNDSSCFDDVVLQITLVEKYLRNPESGLFYHGWDESRQQRWADPETGLSAHVWGRGVGWFTMALVDVLDFLPENHPQRLYIIEVLQRLAIALADHAEQESGLWYQVMDLPDATGNYLESTASTMFVYSLFKAVNKGYIDIKFSETAKKGFKGILKNFITENSDHTISINRCCAGAGLGGDPYRDGSYEYYISTEIRDNDPKAVGPFILAALEYSTFAENSDK